MNTVPVYQRTCSCKFTVNHCCMNRFNLEEKGLDIANSHYHIANANQGRCGLPHMPNTKSFLTGPLNTLGESANCPLTYTQAHRLDSHFDYKWIQRIHLESKASYFFVDFHPCSDSNLQSPDFIANAFCCISRLPSILNNFHSHSLYIYSTELIKSKSIVEQSTSKGLAPGHNTTEAR